MSYNVLQSVARWLDVVLTAQSNGIDPVVDAVNTDLVVRYSKEGDLSATLKVVAAGDWRNLGDGVYRLQFSIAELNTLGSFTYSVKLAPAYACVPFMPYYGHVDVVTADVTQLNTLLTTVDGKIDTIDGAVSSIDTKVDTIDAKADTIIADIESITFDTYQVGLGAHYDEDNTNLKASLVLHHNGEPVISPISASLVVYDDNGNLLLNATNLVPDAQGIFRFDETIALTAGTVPYASGVITDVSGAHSTVTLTPVVG